MVKAGPLVFFLLVCVACSKVSDDATRPEILRFEVPDAVFEPGDVIQVKVHIRDNEALSQVRLRLLPAFAKSYGEWKDVRVFDASGKEFIRDVVFLVPDSALAGLYSFGLQAVDMRGNSTLDSIVDITVLQPGIGPELIDLATAPMLSVGSMNELSANDSIIFSGFAAGDSLVEIRIEMKNTTGSNLRQYTYALEAGTDTWDFELNADTVRFAEFNTFPALMVVRVRDSRGHQARVAYPLFILPE